MVTAGRLAFILLFFALLPAIVASSPQEAKVNQKKIERDRENKHKRDLKEYDQAVRLHNKMQSKSTKASMKKTKKESKRVTPSMH